MIRKNSINAALPVVANLGDRALKVIANSPVHEMAVAAMPPQGTEITGENLVDVIFEASSISTIPVTHDLTLERYVKTLGSAVVRHAAFARNVVNPICGRIIAKVNEALSISGMVDIEVVPTRLSAAVASVQTADMLSRYDAHRAVATRFVREFPELSEADLVESLKTGSLQYDQLLAEMVAAHPEGWVESIYRGVFIRQDFAPINESEKGTVSYFANQDLADEYLVIHLLARYLFDNPPADYPQALSDYQSAVATHVSAAAAALNNTLIAADRRTQQQILVVRWDKKRVLVNGPVYDMFLENGGQVEAIFGAALTAPVSGNTYMRAILDNSDALCRAYNTFITNRRQEAVAQAAQSAFGAAQTAISVEINSLTDADNVCNIERPDMHRAALEAFQGIAPAYFTENTYANVRTLVCRIMFPGSNANELLSIMDKEMEMDPNIDVRHAAYLAVMRIMAKHLASQVG